MFWKLLFLKWIFWCEGSLKIPRYILITLKFINHWFLYKVYLTLYKVKWARNVLKTIIFIWPIFQFAMWLRCHIYLILSIFYWDWPSFLLMILLEYLGVTNKQGLQLRISVSIMFYSSTLLATRWCCRVHTAIFFLSPYLPKSLCSILD